MQFRERLTEDVRALLRSNFQLDEQLLEKIQLTDTRKEFSGDYTLVVFPISSALRQKPEDAADTIGKVIVENLYWCGAFNVVKGFLNLSITSEFLQKYLHQISSDSDFWRLPVSGERVLVEYASPNTNKPLHLGHVRNFLLGSAMASILEACGYEVLRTQVINDRGIAICKSMLAWQLYADGATPESAGIKSDHFVGSYYVMFERKFQEEYAQWKNGDEADEVYRLKAKPDMERDAFFKQYKNEYFNTYSSLGKDARNMLLAWENGDPDVMALWRQMNNWVHEGFEQTYRKFGIRFDSNYYESDTYLLGKEISDAGLSRGIFYTKPDGSVWVDLSDAGLDEKVILRSDGTSVYITQDLGTAEKRFEDFQAQKMIYVVADEQNYHFQVLFEILKRLGVSYADGLYHLSYGMVELPEGKMKSREGTVVDADDLLNEVIEEARLMSLERGELDGLDDNERSSIIEKIGIGALKYFMLKVQPKKKMLFDPRESVDMQGNTGPYIQNAYVRIQSVLRKMAEQVDRNVVSVQNDLHPAERALILHLLSYPEVLQKAGQQYDPSEMADYAYHLARAFHRFYHDCPILSAETEGLRSFRLLLAETVAKGLDQTFSLLGIGMPDRM